MAGSMAPPRLHLTGTVRSVLSSTFSVERLVNDQQFENEFGGLTISSVHLTDCSMISMARIEMFFEIFL
jgi:hypothetical protein